MVCSGPVRRGPGKGRKGPVTWYEGSRPTACARDNGSSGLSRRTLRETAPRDGGRGADPVSGLLISGGGPIG
jgi:hypothetical protein